jgi:hypothetical protein
MALMKFKRSAVPAKVPSIADLALGELAINTYDGKLYLKKDNGTQSVVEIGAGGGGGSGTVTSVSGTGSVSGLTLTGTVTTSGSLTLGGTLALTSGDITSGLGYTPATAAQGAKADTAVQTIASTDGSVTITGTTAIDLSVAVAGSTSNVLLPVRNTTGATLTKGTAVYISGATGQISTVSKAIATSDPTSAQTLGLVTANIANNANGNVTLIGTITNIDTSAYTDGQQLYLSPTTAGTLTATKPYAPQHLVYMAVVEHAHPSQGKLFVKVQNGYEMDELHDVSAQSPANNDGLFFNTSTSLWEKKSIVTALGYTPYNATNPAGYTTNVGTVTSVSGTGTVSGLTLTGSVTSSGSLTLGGTLTLTSGNVTTALGYTPYNATNPAGYITSSALTPYALLSGAAFTGNVTTTGNVGIGTNSPAVKLDVNGSINFGQTLISGGGVSTGDCAFELGGNRSGSGNSYIDLHSASGTDFESRIIRYGGTNGGMDIINSGTGGMVLSVSGAAPVTFQTNSTERMRVGSNGGVAIGGTATDATLHIQSAVGGYNRLTQMAPSGTSKDAFNIMAAKNSGGSDLWWSWGVDTSNRWRINQGLGFANNGVIMDDVGQITSADVAAAFGYKGLPQNQRTSAYTLALSDIGKHLYVTAGAFAVTIPADGTLNFPVGAATTFVCEDAAKTIVPASGVTLVLAGTGAATTGTRTLAIGSVATLIKVQANRWYISGAGVT